MLITNNVVNFQPSHHQSGSQNICFGVIFPNSSLGNNVALVLKVIVIFHVLIFQGWRRKMCKAGPLGRLLWLHLKGLRLSDFYSFQQFKSIPKVHISHTVQLSLILLHLPKSSCDAFGREGKRERYQETWWKLQAGLRIRRTLSTWLRNCGFILRAEGSRRGFSRKKCGEICALPLPTYWNLYQMVSLFTPLHASPSPAVAPVQSWVSFHTPLPLSSSGGHCTVSEHTMPFSPRCGPLSSLGLSHSLRSFWYLLDVKSWERLSPGVCWHCDYGLILRQAQFFLDIPWISLSIISHVPSWTRHTSLSSPVLCLVSP